MILRKEVILYQFVHINKSVCMPLNNPIFRNKLVFALR